jgi:hypothetical protein
VTELRTVGVSNYNGLVVSFQHRFGDGIIQANYTYSHSLDEVSNGGASAPFTSASATEPQNPFNIRESYGSSEYDTRHSFNASYVWQLPVKKLFHSIGPDYLIEGWQVAGTIFARTGFPYTVFDGLKAGFLPNNNFFVLSMLCPSGQSHSGDHVVRGPRFRLLPLPASRPKYWRMAPHQILEHTSFRPDAKQILIRGTFQGRWAHAADPPCSFRKGATAFEGRAISTLISASSRIRKYPVGNSSESRFCADDREIPRVQATAA